MRMQTVHFANSWNDDDLYSRLQRYEKARTPCVILFKVAQESQNLCNG